MVPRHLILPLCLLAFLAGGGVLHARTHRFPPLTPEADSLLMRVLSRSEAHDQYVRHYESELYTKSRIQRLHSNVFWRTVPQTMSFERGVNEYLSENYSQLNYTAPYMYDRKVIATYGTWPRQKKEASMMLDFFNVNLYKKTLIADRLISPFVQENRRYYSYRLDSVVADRSYWTFQRRFYNNQLVSGTFVLDNVHRCVVQTVLQGRLELIRFSLQVWMGDSSSDLAFLPVRYDMQAQFRFVGNNFDARLEASQSYQRVMTIYEIGRKRRTKHHHDLTDRYALQVDTARYLVDSTLVAQHRDSVLRPDEQLLYEQHAQRVEARASVKPTEAEQSRRSTYRTLGNVGEAFVSDYRLVRSTNYQLRMSPIINPVLFNYSTSQGYSYRQDFRWRQTFNSGRQFTFQPRIGYNFTYKEFYWRLRSSFMYWPQKQAQISMEAGSGNRVFTDRITDKLQQEEGLDSATAVRTNLNAFKDFRLILEHKIEVINGLKLTTGLNMHRRTPTLQPEIQLQSPLIRSEYTTFAPRVRVDYTPGQYYYWNRSSKVDVYSPFPTFSLDWERGIQGVIGSVGHYERWEFEVNHQHRFDLLRSFYWQAGMGIFTNQSAIYFVDFNNFAHSHVPYGWEDELSGTFQLLRRSQYNASRRYMRGNFTYDSPLLALTRLPWITRQVRSERLYLGVLIMPGLLPYNEFGYGIATHVLDLGFFVSMTNGHYERCGVRFTFELFND